MPSFALNHTTVARLEPGQFLAAASALGCVGVEVRDGLAQPLFDGFDPADAGAMAHGLGLRILALAEVKRFNDWSEAGAGEALALMATARACGAEAVSLIPRNANGGMRNGERQANLRVALKALLPTLEDHGPIGLVDPLGLEVCALRLKSEAAEAIDPLGATCRVRLVHDAFYHHLAGGGPLCPWHTAIVHLSGVTNATIAPGDKAGRDCVLVDALDAWATWANSALVAAGWDGPANFKAFALETHALADPVAALRHPMDFIRDRMARVLA